MVFTDGVNTNTVNLTEVKPGYTELLLVSDSQNIPLKNLSKSIALLLMIIKLSFSAAFDMAHHTPASGVSPNDAPAISFCM